MSDLTVIYMTLSKLPRAWQTYQRDVLAQAIGDYPLISISPEPLGLGKSLIDDGRPGYLNIYRQLLRGAKEAKTLYIAMAEDDVLYCPDHFSFYRPPLDTFAYNQHRWALFTWGAPTYNIRQRKSNCSLIAPRELAIEALEERFAKWPGDTMPKAWTGELGRSRVEKWLGVTQRKSVEVFSETGIVQFNHGLATEDRQQRKHKKFGQIKAYDIPHWGRADELVKRFR